ncbi:MAG: zinc-ribbon domain-containing protein [Armatimonadetes bacterium]|nr:zinc-ribbon domain-containing protein [Armatimonadota bacterium]
MKLNKILAVAIVALACTGLASAQASKMANHKSMKTMHSSTMKSKKMYACVKCDMANMKGGKCPMCGDKMMPVKGKVMYACADCHTTSMKMGKCPTCGKAMQKVVETYACEDCHTTSTKMGKCPKCGMAMKKMDIPMKG